MHDHCQHKQKSIGQTESISQTGHQATLSDVPAEIREDRRGSQVALQRVSFSIDNNGKTGFLWSGNMCYYTRSNPTVNLIRNSLLCLGFKENYRARKYLYGDSVRIQVLTVCIPGKKL